MLPTGEANLLSFIDNLPGWAWIKDTSGRYCFVNGRMAKAGGLEAAKRLGREDTDILTVSLAGDADRNDLLVLEEGRPLCEIESGREGGEPRHFLVSRFPIRTADATLVGGIAIDLTNRVRLERSLAEAREKLFRFERARLTGQISSSLAHGLNNTLNAISLRLWSMRTEVGLGEENPSLQRLSRLVNDAAAGVRRLQEFSRVQYDQPVVELNITDVIIEAISTVQGRILTDHEQTQTGRRITFDGTLSTLSPVLGKTPDVHYLFVNLFLHADGIMPPGATLHVTAQNGSKRVVVGVAAQGMSFSEDVWARFLDPFGVTEEKSQVDDANLRISMAETLMVQLGGSIAIEGTGEVGNNFVLKLSFPRVDSYQSKAPLAPAKAPLAPGPQRRLCRNLLLIDDDTDNLEEMKTVLELRGYTIRTASNGPEGLKTFAAGAKIDAIVCDLGMPGMNGWEVAGEMARSAPEIPVYLVTGWADGIPVEDPRRKLVTAVLGKPINLPELEKLLLSVGGH